MPGLKSENLPNPLSVNQTHFKTWHRSQINISTGCRLLMYAP